MGELEEIRELHHPSPYEDACYTCHSPWPCDTAVALAEVERLAVVQ